METEALARTIDQAIRAIRRPFAASRSCRFIERRRLWRDRRTAAEWLEDQRQAIAYIEEDGFAVRLDQD